MKKLLFLFVIVGLLWPFPGLAATDPVLESGMRQIETKIHGFETTAHLLEGLSAFVIVIGLVIGMMQAGDFRGKKTAVAALGVISAAIVGLTPVFSRAGYRAYENVADQAQHKLDNFSWKVKSYAVLTDQLKSDLVKELGNLLDQVSQLEDTQINNAAQPVATTSARAAGGFSFLPEAWAQEPTVAPGTLPLWVTKVPVDNNIYFLGKADGKTLDEAHDKALANARTGATSAWVQRAGGSQLAGKTQLVEQLAKTLGSTAEPSQSYAEPIPGGGFRGYVLLRLSRSAAAFTAQSIFSEAGAQPDQKLIQTIRAGNE